ncbi:hypothetical protein ACLB1M_21625 [Escherichia coli]
MQIEVQIWIPALVFRVTRSIALIPGLPEARRQISRRLWWHRSGAAITQKLVNEMGGYFVP